ncbi:hypothetical protein JZ751_009391 [Albula glossodonta]|uniref:RRM domain-containing protein n=1 Tax=Albula glossodonta TaxID=121402 RepID=A0A8T2N810_9TELE|nr:hypothetical protein JZ751_009391 [Albula glossodonta]
MNCSTNVIQVTNVSPSTTSEQMRTLFGFLGKIEELRLFPPDDSPLPVTSRVCFVKFHECESVGVSQHLTNTVFVDRALIVVPFAEANAVAGLLPGGGLLPTPNPLASIGGMPLAALGGPNLDPALAALGLPGSNINSQTLAADQLLKFMTSVDPKLNHVTTGLSLNPGLKADASNKEIEEAMKRVREAQSLISAAIEPGNKKDSKRKHSRSRSRSRRRRSRSRSRHRDRKKEEKEKKRSKTPPKSYSATRRSRSVSRRRRRSRSASRSPRRKPSRSPSPRRHKKEKKKDREREKERDRSRDERERSTSKKKKSKDKDRERERDRDKKSDDKGDSKVMRDYDEEEQGYDSDKDREEKRDSDSAPEPADPPPVEKNASETVKGSKVNGDDHHEEDMDMSD